MTLSIIVAIGKNNAIGFKNALLWSLPNDMKRFKNITTGHTVIMGRNTYLSLPKGALPNRKNIVISDLEKDNFKDCTMARSIDEAVNIAKFDGEIFVMGGASIYRQFLPLADKLYLTLVDDAPEADAFFPEIDMNAWEITENQKFEKDEKHIVGYRVMTLERKNKGEKNFSSKNA